MGGSRGGVSLLSYQPRPPRSLPVASHSGALVTVNHYCLSAYSESCMGGADDLAQ